MSIDSGRGDEARAKASMNCTLLRPIIVVVVVVVVALVALIGAVDAAPP